MNTTIDSGQLQAWIASQYAYCLKQHPGDRTTAVRLFAREVKEQAKTYGIEINQDFQRWVMGVMGAVDAELEREQEELTQAAQVQAAQAQPHPPEAVPEIQFSDPPPPSVNTAAPGAIQQGVALNGLVEQGETLETTPMNPYKEEGDQIAAWFSRIPGINLEFIWLDCDYRNPRVRTHKIWFIDDPKKPIVNLEKLSSYTDLFAAYGFAPENTQVSIQLRHQHIAVEIPNENWTPPILTDIIPKDETGTVIKAPRDSPLLIWTGLDKAGDVFELNLSQPLGAHVCITGSNGGGKSNLFHAIVYGTTIRYPKDYFRLVLVDVHEVSFQFYKHLNYWFWQGFDVASTRAAIEDIFRFAPDGKAHGALFAEYEKRKTWFKKAGVDNIDSYNRKALRSNGELPFLERILVLVDEMAAVVELFGKEAATTIKLWIKKMVKEFRKFGIHLISASQDATADYDGVYDNEARGEFGWKIALYCNTEEVSGRALGNKKLTMATQLEGYGDSFIICPGKRLPNRVQIFYMPGPLMSQMDKVAARYKSSTPKNTAVRESPIPKGLLGEAESDDRDWALYQKMTAHRNDWEAKKRTPFSLRQVIVGMLGEDGVNYYYDSMLTIDRVLNQYEPDLFADQRREYFTKKEEEKQKKQKEKGDNAAA